MSAYVTLLALYVPHGTFAPFGKVHLNLFEALEPMRVQNKRVGQQLHKYRNMRRLSPFTSISSWPLRDLAWIHTVLYQFLQTK